MSTGAQRLFVRSPPYPRRAPFYFAEATIKQYLAKKPDGYCGLGGTGVIGPSRTRRRSPLTRNEGRSSASPSANTRSCHVRGTRRGHLLP